MKRFWNQVTVESGEGGYAIQLDNRPLRTPSKSPCLLPTHALARAVAAEWAAVEGEINPAEMPLTRAANSTIDRVISGHEVVAGMISAFGQTDLICYRAPHPDKLIRRQSAAWDPLIEWVRKALDVHLTLAVGVLPVTQPPESLVRLDAAVRAHSAWELTALHDLVTVSGSLVIGLAVSHGHLDAEAAWPLGRIDEDWNIAEWGEDDEAATLAESRRKAFTNAARLLALVRV